MKSRNRILSVLNTAELNYATTGMPIFSMRSLKVEQLDDNFKLPTNLRLGHFAEKIVSELINASSNYRVLHENIQIIKDKDTLGELDFILEEVDTEKLIHMELAYKFYLYDPNISSNPIANWIGPNRNDSLIEKLDKLKNRQFPLLFHESLQAIIPNIDISMVSQELCFLVSLYVPFKLKVNIDPSFETAIRGYYLDLQSWKSIDSESKFYYIPKKIEWGMDPWANDDWSHYIDLYEQIEETLSRKKSVLCWEKNGSDFTSYFITWW